MHIKIEDQIPDCLNIETDLASGYYADPEADCQVFHICTDDGLGGLSTNSFLCPNGTVFNQQYFICDWWFNFDCSEAEALAAEKNGELAAARDLATAAAADAGQDEYAAGSESEASYAAPAEAVAADSVDTGYGAPEEAADDYSDLAGYQYSPTF